MRLEQLARGADDLRLLEPIDAARRAAEILAGAHPHFDDDQHPCFQGHHVQLARPTPEVPQQDRDAPGFQAAGDEVFRAAPGCDVGRFGGCDGQTSALFEAQGVRVPEALSRRGTPPLISAQSRSRRI